MVHLPIVDCRKGKKNPCGGGVGGWGEGVGVVKSRFRAVAMDHKPDLEFIDRPVEIPLQLLHPMPREGYRTFWEIRPLEYSPLHELSYLSVAVLEPKVGIRVITNVSPPLWLFVPR